MTSPYPPQQAPRKLERSRSNRVLGGVCAGTANYLNMDPTLVRVLTVIASLFFGAPIIVYVIAWFLMPEEDPGRGPQNYPPVSGPQWSYGGYPQGDVEGMVPPQQPSYAPSPSPQASPTPPYRSGSVPPEDPAVWGAEGAPWEAKPSDQGAPPEPPQDERR